MLVDEASVAEVVAVAVEENAFVVAVVVEVVEETAGVVGRALLSCAIMSALGTGVPTVVPRE